MDFGKVPNVDEADFTFPPDHPANKKILNKKDFINTKVYVGCAKWGRKEWVGKIYPPKTKEKDFLSHYVKQYNCIELNTTHYRIYKAEVIEGWRDLAGPEFKFCPKFYQQISHRKRLKDCEKITEIFYNSIFNFKNNLGDCFLQLPPNFAPKNFEILKKYLEQLPKSPHVCVEFRHPDWFNDKGVFDETFSMLNELNIGSVITDTAGRRDVLHMRLSNKTAFIRFVGNNLHASDFKRIDDWVKRLKKWMRAGLDTVYFMMHMHDEKDSPELTAYTIQQLNKHCKFNLQEPQFIKPAEENISRKGNRAP